MGYPILEDGSFDYDQPDPAPQRLTDPAQGYGEQFTPVTVREPHTGITHTANDYVDASNLTLCGLDASKWVGFSYDPPICAVCADKLEELTAKP